MVTTVIDQNRDTEVRASAFYRVAWNVRHMWVECGTSDTRLFMAPLISDRLVLAGHSKGGTYREHAVPRIILRDECHKKLEMDNSVESLPDLANFIRTFLKVVLITNEEQKMLDYHLGLKQKMPDGWAFGHGSPYSRLDAAGIVYELY